jgi:hypothetical protein
MSLIGALGLAVQLVEDPEGRVRRRWQRRSEPQATDNGRLSRLRLAKVEAVTELARKGGNARWVGSTPEQRAATVARLNAARLEKLRAGTTQAPQHRPMVSTPDRALAAFEAWVALRSTKPCPAEAKRLVEAVILA